MNAEEKLEALLEATKTENTIIDLPLEVYELDWLFEVIFPDAIDAADARKKLLGGWGTTSDSLRITRKRYLRRARKAGYVPRQERKAIDP